MSKKSLKRCLLVGSSFLSVCGVDALHAANTQQNAKASERVDENLNDKPVASENANRYANLHDKLNKMQSQLDLISGYLASDEVGQTDVKEKRYVADAKSSDKNKMDKKQSMNDLNSTFCHTNGGAGIAAEFLWWSTNYNFPYFINAISNEDAPVTVQPNVTKTVNNITGAHIIHTNHKWSPGVRLALSFFPDYDDIDMGLLWTYYYNNSKGTNTPSGQNDVFVASDGGGVKLAKASLSLNYNVADFELGKSYFANSKVLLRPFAGVRAVWLDQDHNVRFDITDVQSNVGTPPATVTVQTPWSFHLDQDLWAVGPRAGLNTSWFKWHGLSVMANVSASLLYGRADQSLRFDINTTDTDNNAGVNVLEINETVGKINDAYWQLFPALQLFMGASWERCVSKDTSIKLYAGWEANFLWETQNILFFDRPISMQGLTAGMSVNF